MIDIRFEWSRSLKYESATMGGRRLIKAAGQRRDKPFEPLKIDGQKPLYLRFAELDGSEETCLQFAHHWGLLLTQSQTGGEFIDDWRQQIEQMREAVALLGPIEDLPASLARKRRTGEAWKLTSLDVLLAPSPADTDRFSMILRPRNLFEAMRLQLATSVASGGSVRACKQCGSWFETGASESRRSIAIFCSEKCKNRFHYLERSKR